MLLQEEKILAAGVLLFVVYLGAIGAAYAFSAEDANHLLAMTVANFLFGRAAGISYGFSAGFTDLLVVSANIVIELITVLLVYPLFVLSWEKSLDLGWLKGFFLKIQAQRIKYGAFFDRYGKYGLFLFVWFPFWMTGPVVGSIIGFLIGIKHYHTMFIVLTGTSLAIVVWTYFLKEVMFLLEQFSAYAPHVLVGVFIGVAITFRLIKKKSREAGGICYQIQRKTVIIDKIEHFQDYHFGQAWGLAFDFLRTLTPETEEQKYPIQGDDIFAIVMSYRTFSPEMALFEAHREYVDIQTVLVGAEGFECAFCDGLSVERPYDEGADITFYKRRTPGPVRVDLYPGSFTVFYPQDAHMPGLIVGNEEKTIKKVVVKIRKELII